jgi:hypothetical protein
MDDMDMVDQIALIAGRLADLAGKHRGTVDVEKLAEELQAQIAELSRIQGQLMGSKSAAPPGMIGNPFRP